VEALEVRRSLVLDYGLLLAELEVRMALDNRKAADTGKSMGTWLQKFFKLMWRRKQGLLMIYLQNVKSLCREARNSSTAVDMDII
jgi:hypothetical protein